MLKTKLKLVLEHGLKPANPTHKFAPCGTLWTDGELISWIIWLLPNFKGTQQRQKKKKKKKKSTKSYYQRINTVNENIEKWINGIHKEKLCIWFVACLNWLYRPCMRVKLKHEERKMQCSWDTQFSCNPNLDFYNFLDDGVCAGLHKKRAKDSQRTLTPTVDPNANLFRETAVIAIIF